MTKKTAILAMVLSMMMTMASCGSEKDNTAKAETEKAPQTTAAQAEDKAEETTAAASPESEPEETASAEISYTEDYIDKFGLKLLYPAEDKSDRTTPDGKQLMQFRNTLNYASWTEKVKDGSDVDTTKAYAIAVGNGFQDKEALTEEEAKQYFFDHMDVLQLIDKGYNISAIHEVNVETSETVQVLGKEFLRETGVMHCGSAKAAGETIDIAYAAYYGTPGFTDELYKTAPVMWIAYSSHLDEASKADIAQMADKAAADAVIN